MKALGQIVEYISVTNASTENDMTGNGSWVITGTLINLSFAMTAEATEREREQGNNGCWLVSWTHTELVSIFCRCRETKETGQTS